MATGMPPSTPKRPPTGSTSSAPPSPGGTLDAAGTATVYKDLANLERDFRYINGAPSQLSRFTKWI